jgi:hypothetical protein
VCDGASHTHSAVLYVAGVDWVALNRFAQAARFELLFDLNVLLRNGTQWDSSNARQLLDFSDRLRFNITWQLGNGTVREQYSKALNSVTVIYLDFVIEYS